MVMKKKNGTKKKGMARGGMKKKGMAKGGAMMMKKKGMAKGGMKKKGYAKGGMPTMGLAQIRAAAKAKGYKLIKV